MGVVTDCWAWLDTNSKQVGALSSMAFGLSSAVVAWVALRLSYRNNYGAKPLVLVTTLGGAVDRASGTEFATFKCEVWNRRKYSINLKMISVRLRAVDVKGLLDRSDVFHGEWTLMNHGVFVQALERGLGSGEYATYGGKLPVNPGTGFEMPRVRVAFFDPMAGVTMYVRGGLRHRWRWMRWHLKWKVRRGRNFVQDLLRNGFAWPQRVQAHVTAFSQIVGRGQRPRGHDSAAQPPCDGEK